MVRETCDIIFGEEVKQKLIQGSEKTAKAVSTTFGPFGKNVALTKLYNLPHVTQDGVTVIKEISLKNPAENVACQALKEASKKTALVAGDGTSSTAILANALIKHCFDYLKDKPTKTNYLKQQLLIISKELEKQVLKQSKDVNTEKLIRSIANVSSKGDQEIVDLVTAAFMKIGKEGIVNVLSSNSYDTFIDTTEGVRLDRTHISPLLEDKDGKTKVSHEGARTLICDLDFTTVNHAFKLFALQEEIGVPLLVICNDLTGSALTTIAFNKAQKNIPIEVIRAPFIADARREAIKDLAIITGAVPLMKDKGYDILSIDVDKLGYTDAVEISLRETNIIGRKGDPTEIENRIQYYKDKIKADTAGLKENYIKRMAYFTSGASVIYVGGANDIEVQDKKDRVDDTIRAVRAALDQGYVIGGTEAYFRAYNKLKIETELDSIIWKSLTDLKKTIFDNGELDFDDYEVLEAFNKSIKKNHIIDPTLVVTSTIKNAIGAAIMIFSTDCIVIKNEDNG